MRRLPALAVPAAVAALVLAGCTGEAAPDPTATSTDEPVADTCTAAGGASDAVDVTGSLGAEPTVFVDSPVEVDATQRTVVVEGDGPEVVSGDLVSVSFAVYNGTTGELATATTFGEAGALLLTVADDQLLPGLYATILCSTEGSRVVGVVTPDDAFGSAGQADFGIDPDTTLVFVVDVVSIVAAQAEGEEQDPLGDEFPEVVWDEDGRPTVTIPDADPSGDLEIGLVLEGDGPVVGQDDEFTIHYQGVNWSTGEIFDESWGGAPRSFTSVISGFKKAIVGQTVGSRVVVVIPPDEGYGEDGNASAGIGGEDTLVFVIDILATTPPQ